MNVASSIDTDRSSPSPIAQSSATPGMDESHTERLEAALDGKYQIERKLGQGGRATVYLADLRHERKLRTFRSDPA